MVWTGGAGGRAARSPRSRIAAGLALALAGLLAAVPAPLLAQSPPATKPASQPASADRGKAADHEWDFESIELKDRTVYSGLIQAESPGEIEFVEIFRPAGKPMFAVVRPVDAETVARQVRLPEEKRGLLAERFEQLRNRARIEAGRMQDVELRAPATGEAGRWIYEGSWFRLESSADEEMTRRCVVRIEQIFRAYRQLLPPRREPRGDLRLVLLGSVQDYRDFMRSRGFLIQNPAFFSASQNLIVAGSELNAYARRLAQIREHHAEVRRQYSQLDQSFTARLSEALSQLKQNGFSDAELEQESRLRRAAWDRERSAALAKIAEAERGNESRFADVTRQMFQRLYHEAFHAYVEGYVYSHGEQPLPRWLNEGLAQIFETAQLDAETLRIDAPDAERLRRLQADLASGVPWRLAEVLAAGENEFLDDHRSESGQRLYLYAWGLAYFLTYDRNVLQRRLLDEYVANRSNLGSAARFAILARTPLAEFEPLWRKAMAEIKP